MQLDRLVINLGVWTINDGADYPYGIYFTDFKLEPDSSAQSIAGGRRIEAKEDAKIWWLGKYMPFTHIAGNHRYILGTKKMKTDM